MLLVQLILKILEIRYQMTHNSFGSIVIQIMVLMGVKNQIQWRVQQCSLSHVVQYLCETICSTGMGCYEHVDDIQSAPYL